jgi:hypothetical protein
MAFTKEDIGNLALSHLGEARINNFEEQSEEAKECKLWYDACRLETLEAHDWNFARTRSTLETHNEAATTGVWCFRYKYPNTAIFFRRLQHPYSQQSKKVPFIVELAPVALDRSIQTNLDSAIGIYTVDQSNVALFSPKFVTSLSHLMAARMAKALNGTDKDQRLQYQLWQGMLSSAQASNANEHAAEPIEDADVILARSGGTSFTTGDQVNIWDVPGNNGS